MNKMAREEARPVLAHMVTTAGHLAENRLDGALAAHGLSLAKLGVLSQLARADEPLTLGQLAERIACVKSNITQLVDRLEQNGLVQRIPDSSDRRCMRAALTEEGRRRYELGIEEQIRVEQQLTKNLSREEQRQLAVLLGKLIE